MESLQIIRATSGDWVAPRDAFVIPPSLQYKGLALFDKSERNCADRNSGDIEILPTSDYDVRFLEALGCRVLCKDQVRTILSNSKVSFAAKDYGWIAALFQYLQENPDADPLTAAYLQLANGQWIAPQDCGKMYLGDATEVPFQVARIKITLIDPKFVGEIFQNEMAKLYLMDRLKAEKLSEVAIINAIFDRHAQGPSSTDSSTGVLDKKECHGHALYLTRHQHLIDRARRSKNYSPFYVITRNGSIREARDTVCNRLHSSGKKKFLPISDVSASSVSFLSPHYPRDVSRFLTDRMGVKLFSPPTEHTLPANLVPKQNNTPANSDHGIHLCMQSLRTHAAKKINGQVNKQFLEGIYTELIAYVQKCQPRPIALLREKFREEPLLVCSYGSSAKHTWSRRVDVYRACPEFVQATLTPVQTKSKNYHTLCQFLDLPQWSSGIHLEPELRSTFKTRLSYKKWQRYLHKALVWIAREKTHISPSGPTEWLFVILGLPVYPVLTPSGETRYSTLKPSIAVPDSQRLLGHLKGKIHILDFGDLPIQEIIPVLKYARDPPTLLSSYDVQEPQVTPTEPVFLDVFHSRLVGMKRTALTRFLYYKGHRQDNDGFAFVYNTLDSVSIARAAELNKTLCIPELDVSVILSSHVSHMVRRHIPVIYISASADRALTTRLIAHHIAELFNLSLYCKQIELILTTGDSEMDSLLSEVIQLPELPDCCGSFMSDESLASNLFDDALEEVSEPESVDSPKGETTTATFETANQVSTEHAAAKCSVNPDFRNKLDATRYGGLSPGLKSGFAGEFYIFLLLNHGLPGFSEANWTSQFRQYAGFPHCQEGDSDFFYDFDMTAFSRFFNLAANKSSNRAFIEVKTAGDGGNSSRFRLSAAQFQRARTWHGTDTLYLVLCVKDVFTEPSISHVINDPIRFLDEGKLSVAATVTLSIE